MPPAATVKIGYFSVKKTVKVTRSLTLVLFDRVLLVEYATPSMKSLSPLRFKNIVKVKVFARHKHRQTSRTTPELHSGIIKNKNRPI